MTDKTKSGVRGMAVFIAAAVLALQVQAQTAQTQPRHPKHPKFAVTQTKPASNKWLLDADTDTERFRRIEMVTSGFDIPMVEVGTRYEELASAVRRSKWDLAAYQITKITERMNQTAVKRPGRTESLERYFLDSAQWAALAQSVKDKDRSASVTNLRAVTAQCQLCHAAEGLGYMNESNLFLRLEAAQR